MVYFYQGDSGSGLICDKNLTGIVSFGRGCFRKDVFPGVYTDVSSYSEFIDKAVTLDYVKNRTKSTEVQNQLNEAADLWSMPILIVVLVI